MHVHLLIVRYIEHVLEVLSVKNLALCREASLLQISPTARLIALARLALRLSVL